MGFFDSLFGRQPKPTGHDEGFFKTLSAYTPVFTTWGGQIYESELVRSAINTRAIHMSKMRVRIDGTARPTLRTAMKNDPNDFQTWSQFMYRLSTIVDVQNTAFIVPVLDDYGRTIGIYPVLPSRCELVQYNKKPYLRYTFSTGDQATIEFDKCGVVTKFQYSDDIKGENNKALVPTMELIDINNQGIGEGVKSSATFRFMAQMSNFVKPDDLAKERKRFNNENLKGEGGLLLFPNTYSNIQQIHSQPFVVDAQQMQHIRTNVYNYYGVNEDVLQNKAQGDALDAFYNGALEPMAIQIAEAITRMLFTKEERVRGNKVILVADRLQYMTISSKIELAKELGDRGMIYIDEIRELFNYAPLPNGEGQHAPIRGEYYMVGEDKSKDNESEGTANE